jgi:hypothetical protein
MMTLRTRLMSCVLACAAIAGITTAATAQVQSGVVGAGVHQQYGPQDDNGNYLGMSSDSYDWYVDPGFSYTYPLDNSYGAPSGWDGFVLLALNPYTGEVWTDVPDIYQSANPATHVANGGVYDGHTGNTVISGPSGLPDDPGTPDVDESLVYSDYMTNHTPPAGGLAQDCIYITGEHRYDDGGGYFGAFVSASADGALLTGGYDGEFPAGTQNYYRGDVPAGNVIDATTPGTWVDGDPNTSAFGYVGAHNWWYYTGTGGSSSLQTYAFEMDGSYGWVKMAFSGDRTGVRLMEYYFDAPATTRDGDFTDDLGGSPDGIVDAFDIDALADAILNGGDVATFDLVIDGVLDSLDMDMLIASLVDTPMGEASGSFYGDFNLDGVVDLLDLNKLTANYNGFGGWALGDANGDGSIELLDLNKLTANYNATVVVPEPATMTLLALGAVALIRRKK